MSTRQDVRIPLPARAAVALQARFRLPAEDDKPPANRRLFGIVAWAAACVFAGVIPAGRLVAGAFLTGSPGWYPAVTVTLGLLGVGLIAGAFASIHRAYLPWHLLAAATLLLAANIALVYTVR